MAKNLNHQFYLYHIRDPELSHGFGYDGYIGITNNPKRRRKEHLDALENKNHCNERLQELHNRASYGLQYVVLTEGPREQIEARERLLVPKPNHHCNKQVGGGSRRGISQDEAEKSIAATPSSDGQAKRLGEAASADLPGAPQKSAESANVSPETRKSKASPQIYGAAVGVEEALPFLPGLILGGAYLASGLVTARALNMTMLKDEPTLDRTEKESRGAGRKASVLGGLAGAGGSFIAVAACGEVGLGAAAIYSGLTAIGGVVGGGAIVGFCVTVAAPAILAVGAGAGIYKLAKWIVK